MMDRNTLWSSHFTLPGCLFFFFSLVFLIAYRTETTLGVAVSDSSINCIEQTTEWSACSKSCGMGFSTQVTNRNPQCEMVKRTRLCMVRPCEQEHRQPTDKVGLESGFRKITTHCSSGELTPANWLHISSSWELAPEKRQRGSWSEWVYLLLFFSL